MRLKEIMSAIASLIKMVWPYALGVMIIVALRVLWIAVTARPTPVCKLCKGEFISDYHRVPRSFLVRFISRAFFQDRLRKYRCCGKNQYAKVPLKQPSD